MYDGNAHRTEVHQRVSYIPQPPPPPQKDGNGPLKILLGTVVALVSLIAVGAVVLLVSQSNVSTHSNKSTANNNSVSKSTATTSGNSKPQTVVVQPQTTTVVQQPPTVTQTQTAAVEPTQTNSGSTPVAEMKNCDQNIQVDAQSTTCTLGENTFVAYVNSGPPWNDDNVSAHSAKTGENYSMDCTTDHTTVDCTGTAGDATLHVRFPWQAVAVYHGGP